MLSNKRTITILVIAVVIIVAASLMLAFQRGASAPTSSPSPSPSTSTQMSSMSPSPLASTSTSPSVSPTANVVSIENFAFTPATITVKKGTTITWTNQDAAAHTVTADSSGGPASGNLSKGQSYSFTFNAAGTFNYHCALHPGMKATVIVE